MNKPVVVNDDGRRCKETDDGENDFNQSRKTNVCGQANMDAFSCVFISSNKRQIVALELNIIKEPKCQ